MRPVIVQMRGTRFAQIRSLARRPTASQPGKSECCSTVRVNGRSNRYKRPAVHEGSTTSPLPNHHSFTPPPTTSAKFTMYSFHRSQSQSAFSDTWWCSPSSPLRTSSARRQPPASGRVPTRIVRVVRLRGHGYMSYASAPWEANCKTIGYTQFPFFYPLVSRPCAPSHSGMWKISRGMTRINSFRTHFPGFRPSER
ncbi:hypothetical protein BKA93DRAFT_218254 [Sparassis latifolia]